MDPWSRKKAASDPQVSLSPVNPSIQNLRNPLTNSAEFYDRRTTYGTLDFDLGSHSSCCLAQEHLLLSTSREFLKRSLSLESLVHVDISDIAGDGEAPIVPLSLRRCKKMILTPYTVLLSIIGWRPFYKDTATSFPTLWKVINILYPLFVICLMLYHTTLQILICQGKYNIHIDTMPVSTESPTVPPSHPTAADSDYAEVKNVLSKLLNFTTTTDKPERRPPANAHECPHIVPTYIVPGFMHLLAYAYGFMHFRIQEGEQLYSLMEKVFLQAYATPGVQKILIRNSRLYLFGAFLWLLLVLSTEILYNITFNIRLRIFGKLYRFSSLPIGLHYSLMTIKFVGLLLVQCVNLAVVLNYCVQCEMLVFHIKGLCLRLHEKSLAIKDAMHEILGVRAFISQMNETMGKMTSFCIVNFAQLTVVGTALLFLNRNKDYYVVAYRAIFPALWFIALIVPLLQAARLTRVGTKLRQISFEMRVFGYQLATQQDLDSFVLFVNGATLRTRLFGATIQPATIILTFGAAAFVILTLMVVDIVNISGYEMI